MPHVIIKHYPKDIDKEKLIILKETIVSALTIAFDCPEKVTSIGLRPIQPDTWEEEVYIPDIQSRVSELIKKPSYNS